MAWHGVELYPITWNSTASSVWHGMAWHDKGRYGMANHYQNLKGTPKHLLAKQAINHWNLSSNPFPSTSDL